jgi:1-acyl-sn-glycerol-3-phosphate acyltransferase
MKLIRIILHMLRGMWTLKRLEKRNDARLTRRKVQLWHRKALHLFGLERILVGDIPKGPCLIVSNHLSWIDILVIGSLMNVRFLSKAEVASWPIVGKLATGAGTLYVHRGDRKSAEIALDDIETALKQGDQIVVFPEGTSTRGPMPIKFRSSLIEAARRAGVPIVPMALSYHGPGKAYASYAGDDDFVSHMTRLCQAPFIRGRVAISAAIAPTDAAAVIAREAQSNVESMLELMVCEDRQSSGATPELDLAAASN